MPYLIRPFHDLKADRVGIDRRKSSPSLSDYLPADLPVQLVRSHNSTWTFPRYMKRFPVTSRGFDSSTCRPSRGQAFPWLRQHHHHHHDDACCLFPLSHHPQSKDYAREFYVAASHSFTVNPPQRRCIALVSDVRCAYCKRRLHLQTD